MATSTHWKSPFSIMHSGCLGRFIASHPLTTGPLSPPTPGPY